jgi:hypothetical protein
MTVPPVFMEKDGRVIFDIAAAPLPGVFSEEAAYRGIWNEWEASTDVPGFTGNCYYRWAGPEVKWNAGCGPLAYWFFIDEPGLYQITIRNFSHDQTTGKLRANGAFMRFNGQQWHKVKSKIHGEWTWSFMYEHYHDPTEANPSRLPCWRHFDHGIHKMELSGRQTGMMLDRVAIAREGVEVHDLALSVSGSFPLPIPEPAW